MTPTDARGSGNGTTDAPLSRASPWPSLSAAPRDVYTGLKAATTVGRCRKNGNSYAVHGRPIARSPAPPPVRRHAYVLLDVLSEAMEAL